jgi:hypothetical protein
MLIIRTSTLTGVTHTMNLDITLHEYREWEDGALIQNCMPHLTASEREFLISGVTDAEWAEFMNLDLECAE